MLYNCIANKARKERETTNIMRNIIVELYGHPVLFVITLLFILGFLGMTYEFILRLFGKQSDLHSVILNAGKDKEDEEEEDDIVKMNDAEPDSEDEFEEKDDDEDEENAKRFGNY